MFQNLEWAEICERFKDEWVVLGNAQMDGLRIIRAVVVAHHPDKRVVALEGSELTRPFQKIALRFTGKSQPMHRIGLLGRIKEQA